ncbi:MAG: riboflavin kinase, partial [Nannocystis sp.]
SAGATSAGPWPAGISLGRNPTFVDDPQAPLVLEVHALGQDLGDSLYGRTVEVAFAARLRDERRFDHPAQLLEQIGRDLQAVAPALDPASLARFAACLSPVT